MKALYLVGGYCIALVCGCLVVGMWLDRRVQAEEVRRAQQRETIWKARYAEEAVKADGVADTVIREVTKTRTLRDSILYYKYDTARVEEYVYRTDTLLVSCERCAAQLRAFRLVADSTLAAKDARIASLKPRFRDRCGLSVGVGAIRDGTVVRAGPAVGVGCRVWP